MYLLYLADTRIPSRSTNSMQIMRMCESLSKCVAEVKLLIPNHQDEYIEGYYGNIWDFYGVDQDFQIIRYKTYFSTLQKNKLISLLIRSIQYILQISHEIRGKKQPIIIYGRSTLGLWLSDWLRLTFFRHTDIRVFIEMHDLPSKRLIRGFLKRVDGIIAITQALSIKITSLYGVPQAKMIIAHDGVNISRYSTPSKRARINICRQLELNPDMPVIVYTGRVNREKGADLLIDIAQLLCPYNYQMVLVGKVYDIDYYNRIEKLKNTRLVGFVPPSQVVNYQLIADILLLPSTKYLPYMDYMSPLKLFEYMGTKRPIIASDVPVFHEILKDNKNGLLIDQDNPGLWVNAIIRLISEPLLSKNLAAEAYRDVQQYSWKNRAEHILQFIIHGSTSLS